MQQEFSDHFYFRDKELFDTKNVGNGAGIGVSVYEVIKVISGIPLFFEDHLERLKNSLVLSGLEYSNLQMTELSTQIAALCKENDKYFGNIELRISALPDNKCLMLLGFIPHHYPNAEDYEQGIKVGLLQAERTLPNAKVKNTDTRIKANKYLADYKLPEVLLYNHEGLITEGSRSNVFFIKGSLVFTAPASMVLKGISRKYAIKTLMQLGITLVEEALHISDLSQMDGGFICGTSPGVLPLNAVEEQLLDAKNPVLQKILVAFNNQVTDYLASKVKNRH
ncbi:MAG: aminotransferase class IV [Salinivirgaceae bacterium]